MNESYRISDEEEIYRFIEKHLPRGREIAAKYGFAVARPAGEQVSPADRQRKIRIRLVQATGALTDLGQWLDDDVEEVRNTAREAIHKCLQIAYTGDRPEPPRGILERFFHRTDRLVSRYLQRFVDPDQAEPRWAQPRNLRRIRLAGITGALIAAIVAALCFWLHLFPAAIVAIGAMAIIDGLEGSFARVMCMHDAQVRWFSLVASHVGDLVVMLGMSAYLVTVRSFPFAYLMLLVAIVSSMGSMVRVSSLQAGQRFWRSPIERAVRFVSAVGFAILAFAGFSRAGSVVVAIVLVSYATYEMLRTMRRVTRLSVTRGGFIFFSNEGASCWDFDDGEDSRPELAVFERSISPVESAISGIAK